MIELGHRAGYERCGAWFCIEDRIGELSFQWQ